MPSDEKGFSSRDLFAKFKSKQKKSIGEVGSGDEDLKAILAGIPKENWAKFLAGTWIGVVGGLAYTIALEKGVASISGKESKVDIRDYIKTAVEVTAVTSVELLVKNVTDKMGLQIGLGKDNVKKMAELINRAPFEMGVIATGVAPQVEEATFRSLPSVIVGKDNKFLDWGVGIGAAAAFALYHAIELEENKDTGKKTLNLKAKPVVQFFAGVSQWRFMRERGYRNAAFAHSLTNAELLTSEAVERLIKPNKNNSRT
ncbi:MAG TPA: hypothetical protein VG917_04565 [Patescibacteria group bacterium]|nr:hypothetical protein [Patescibacteria group bacterium]